MNQPFSIKHKESLVGAFVIGAGVIFLLLIVFTLIRKEIFEDHYRLKTNFQLGIGLNSGSLVCLAGLQIGTVESIELNQQGEVTVNLRLKKSYEERIRMNSVATIRRINMVGDKIINISPGTPDSPILKENSFLQSENPLELEDVLLSSTLMMKNLDEIITRIRNGEGTIGALLKDQKILDSLEKLIKQGSKTLADGNHLINDLGRLSTNLDSVTTSVPALLNRTNTAIENAGVLASHADTLVQSFNTMVEESMPILEKGKDGISQASKIMNSVQNNWLIKKNLPKQPDPVIIEETLQ
jgi:phospholipid/cholesterol/gamma-HCH transport system substrate-binding protein